MWFAKATVAFASALLLVACPAVAEAGTAVQEEETSVVPVAENEFYGRNEVPATQYASLEAIPDISVDYYEVPAAESGFKSYLDYRTITCRTSTQWELQQEAVTDEYGFRRYGGAYMVAMGTYYSQSCGEVFEITLDSGFKFTALISDIKRDCDTDEKNQHKDGNVVEFIVDKNAIPQKAAHMGDMSYDTPMQGKIVSICKL